MPTAMTSNGRQLHTLKLVITGSSGVGKTALLRKFLNDEWDPELRTVTIGCDFRFKDYEIGGSPYRVNFCDTAGQERFRTLSKSFYRGTHAVMLCYDICNRATFLEMDKWFEEALTWTVEGVVLCLVGTKLDKPPSARQVSAAEGLALAQAHNALFFETSAAGLLEDVKEVFFEAIARVVETPGLIERVRTLRAPGAVVELDGDKSLVAGGWPLIGGCACGGGS
ncbi:hypothetical protein VTI74DRAFT_2168 [Chaetomium olivicolor]